MDVSSRLPGLSKVRENAPRPRSRMACVGVRGHTESHNETLAPCASALADLFAAATLRGATRVSDILCAVGALRKYPSNVLRPGRT
jgi:hypothetical protein